MRGVVSGLPVLSCVLVGLFAVVNCGGSDNNGDGSDPEAGAGGEVNGSGGTSGKGGSAGKGGSSGKGGSAGKGGSSGKGGSAGKGGSSGATAGGEGGALGGEGGTPPVEGGMGGEAGTPGPGVISQAGPRTGFAIVAAGQLTHSENFTLLATLGEEPGCNISMSSEGHRLNLGFVGVTQ